MCSCIVIAVDSWEFALLRTLWSKLAYRGGLMQCQVRQVAFGSTLCRPYMDASCNCYQRISCMLLRPNVNISLLCAAMIAAAHPLVVLFR